MMDFRKLIHRKEKSTEITQEEMIKAALWVRTLMGHDSSPYGRDGFETITKAQTYSSDDKTLTLQIDLANLAELKRHLNTEEIRSITMSPFKPFLNNASGKVPAPPEIDISESGIVTLKIGSNLVRAISGEYDYAAGQEPAFQERLQRGGPIEINGVSYQAPEAVPNAQPMAKTAMNFT